MHCSQCGHPIKSATASFCAYCGTKLEMPCDDLDKTVLAAAVRRRNNPVNDAPVVSVKKQAEMKNASPYFDNNRSFVMPEPEEEDVFETTGSDELTDSFVKAAVENSKNRDPFDDSGLNSFDYSPTRENNLGGDFYNNERQYELPRRMSADGYRQEYPDKIETTEVIRSYNGHNNARRPAYSPVPDGQHTVNINGNAYTRNPQGMSYSERENTAGNGFADSSSRQNVRHEVFTQPTAGSDSFFVQQTPVYNTQSQNKKMKPGMIALIAALIVLLFAGAVAGGIFAASAILNNAVIDNTDSIITFIENDDSGGIVVD